MPEAKPCPDHVERIHRHFVSIVLVDMNLISYGRVSSKSRHVLPTYFNGSMVPISVSSCLSQRLGSELFG
jgi:hypothetical protein